MKATARWCLLLGVAGIVIGTGCVRRYHNADAGISYIPPPHWQFDDSHPYDAHHTPDIGNFGMIYVQPALPGETESQFIAAATQAPRNGLVETRTIETVQGLTLERLTTEREETESGSFYPSVCFIPHGGNVLVFRCNTEAMDMIRLFDRVLESVELEAPGPSSSRP